MNISFPLKSRLNILSHPANGMLPRVWFHQIWRYGFHWTFTPKVITISIIVLLNYPIILLERFLFRRNISRMKIESPIFIVGHARSGTTFLHYLLAQDEQFATPKTYETVLPNTYALLGWILVPFLKIFMPKKRPMDAMSMGPNEPKEEEFALSNMTIASFAHAFYFPNRMQEIFEDTVGFGKGTSTQMKWKSALNYFAKKVCVTDHHNHLLLKSPYNTARIKWILEVFPDAKFIHVKRNPDQVLPSMEKLMQGILPILSFHRVDGDQIKAFILKSYQDVYASFYQQSTGLNEHQLLEVSYERLTRDPMMVLEEIYGAFKLNGLEENRQVFSDYITSFSNYQTNVHRAASEHIHAVQDIRKQLGYD